MLGSLNHALLYTHSGITGGCPCVLCRLIHNILTDAKYIGKIVHKGQAYDAEHPAILSPELFEQVRNVLRSNRVSTHKHQIRRFAMLRRLVHCSHCGSLVMPAWTNNNGRQYRYYTCAKKVKTGYGKCSLPSLPAGELEKAVIDQVRSLIRHPDVIAHTYREVCAGSQTGPDPEVLAQLEDLRQSRHQTYQAARSLLDLKDPDGPLVKSELKRLNDQMKSLDDSIRNLEAATSRTSTIDLAEITQALHRLDPIWEVLYPEEQSRILELLIETVRVSENNVDIRFRTNGIEKIVEELTSQGVRSNG